MAGTKTLTINAPAEQLTLFITALRRYAHAAWPVGGSECAQASRDSLLTFCDELEAELESTRNEISLNKRQRSVYKAALEFHLEHEEFASEHDVYKALHAKINQRKTT
jgi:hypothetical protein